MSEEISSLLKESRIFAPNEEFLQKANISEESSYKNLYKQSIEDPENFWAEQANLHISWYRKWDSVLNYDFQTIGEAAGPYVEFFKGAKLNACYNCVDRHVEAGKGNKTAIIWQGEKEEESKHITYSNLLKEVESFAAVLKKRGAGRGTRVTIFLPMIPQLPIAVLACARIGAIHSVVFSAFSSESLKNRVQDCDSEVVITADVGYHAGKTIPLKQTVDTAMESCPSVHSVIVVNREKTDCSMQSKRDCYLEEEIAALGENCSCPPEEMDSESPLFILYTSGSTGKPKGVLHTTAGYLLYATLTSKYVFDLKEDDVYWCTADVGWITGHSYLIYGPLSSGATCLMFEGVPTYPEADRFWKLIEKYKVSIFYTAPTAIRALMRLGDKWPNSCDLSSLRLLGSVGEPINPEAWIWYNKVIGKSRCPIVDTWWQTETGGICLTTLPGIHSTKPSAAGMPFFGISPKVLKSDGNPAEVNEGGALTLDKPWPGMIRGVYGDTKNELVKNVYFSAFNGVYFTGDGCKVDEDGYHWLLGRIDDVINVSAHRFATAEIESALVTHASVSEAAVVGVPHETKGQGIYCFVTLHSGFESSDALKKELITCVRTEIGPIATPEMVQFTNALPKTRSGKIMRRILRKIAGNDLEQIGDVSTLADPAVVEHLVEDRRQIG